MAEREYWLGFALCSGIGPKRFTQLLQTFSTAEAAWRASTDDLKQVLGNSLTTKFVAFRQEFDIPAYQKRMQSLGCWYVTLRADDYPPLLKKSSNPPFVLFGKGNRQALSAERTVGIVGTRRITTYGRQVTESLTREMVEHGFCIVSGLAMGVDAVAHATALLTKGSTIAVLGCGVDCCSPMENFNLYQQIIEQGSVVISEFPLGQPPTVGSFPSRNRIIAGLSQGVIVTEGAADSGSLITARDAFADSRPVFAVPGPITSHLSEGPHDLLKIGGVLATRSEDILRVLGVASGRVAKKPDKSKIQGATKDEQLVIDLLMQEELSFDELVRKMAIGSAPLNTLLSLLEMKGYISHDETGRYRLQEI